ncbi:ROK family protein [Angustibacter speluncae]
MSAAYVVGVDVGGSKVLATVVDDQLQVRGRFRRDTVPGAAGVRDSVADAVGAALADAGLRPDDVRATGLGVPGLVAPGGTAVALAVNLGLGREPLDLAELLDGVVPGPVSVENDVNAAALGLHALDPDLGDLALLSVGTGLAAGLVVDGELHRGGAGAAGEIGHLQVDPRGPMCRCGQRGCLEVVASGQALLREWPVPAGTSAAQAVWSAAQEGSRRAQGLRSRLVGGLASAVRLLVLSWDVPRVVLAGGVTDLGEPLVDAVRRRLADEASQSELLAALRLPERVQLVPPGVRDVGAVGAAAAAQRAATEGARVLHLAGAGE